MKIQGVSFSKYKVKVGTYVSEKLDFFAFLFVQILLSESIDKNKKVYDCLLDLDIKEDLLYLFDNIYYKFIDNNMLVSIVSENLKDLTIKDIKLDLGFVENLKKGYYPRFDSFKEKEFIYDYLNEKLTIKEIECKESNVCVVEIDNSKEKIQELINTNKKPLLGISEGIVVLKDLIVDPYYFEIELDKKDDYYFTNIEKKDLIYNSLVNNSFIVNEEKILDGDFLSNNIYFECLFSKYDLKDICKYLFVYDKEKEFVVENNIIYVGYDIDYDFVCLDSKQGYYTGKYLLENKQYISTYVKEKCNQVSEFKLYLIKNKEKFNVNISHIIELI